MKFSEAAKKILSAVAPTIATALGGPLAGAATAQILAKFGGDPQATEAALASASPETLVQLKQLDLEFQKFLAQNDIDLEKIHAGDRANAREREIRMGDWTTRILAYTVIGSFCALVFSVLFGQVQAESTIAGAVIGYLSAKAEQVIAYYFGSSQGSKQKTDLLGSR